MEKTFEQVQSENTKLNERLKNAIQVFKQQKEELARLTAERDEYKSQCAAKDETITSLEARIAEAGNNDQKFFEQLEEIDGLNTHVDELTTLLDNTKDALSKTQDTLAAREETLESTLDSLTAANASIDSLKSTVETLRQQVRDRVSDIKGISDAIVKLAASCKKQSEKIEKEEIA